MKWQRAARLYILEITASILTLFLIDMSFSRVSALASCEVFESLRKKKKKKANLISNISYLDSSRCARTITARA